MMKGTFFWGVLVLEGLVGLHKSVNFSHFSIHDWGIHLITVMLNGLPWKRIEIILSFLRLHPSTAFQTLLLTMKAALFLLKAFLPTVVDIMVI